MAKATLPQATDYFPLARKLARSYSPYEADEDDLIQEGMIALVKALRKTPNPDKPVAFASTVLSRTMSRYRSTLFYTRTPPNHHNSVSLTCPHVRTELSRCSSPSPTLEGLAFEEYLTNLERACGRKARWLAENLVTPGEGLRRWMVLDFQEAEAREGGHRRKHVDVTHKDCRSALGLSVPRWFKLLHEVRDFTLLWFQDDRELLASFGLESEAEQG